MAALLSSRQGLTFDHAEPKSRARADRFAPEDAEPDLEPHLIPGELSSDCSLPDLQRRLGNLRRRAREWEDEQGLSILFLALGFLQWVDEQDERAVAPLLLLPCHLERPSPRDPFVLQHDEDDLTENSTLTVKMREFGVELPETNSEAATAAEYLDAVREVVKPHPEWKVDENVYLGTFGYSKLAMWRDLEVIKRDGTDHEIVLSLAGADPSESDGGRPPSDLSLLQLDDLRGGRLDDLLDVRDQFVVLPADYSQLMAIETARTGRNLVIHGPPGTGKSQTIANIIATLLADGKSILFVSEKTAALDVVKRRLDEKDLGVFCLDLHSERGSKASVYQQLQRSVDDRRAVRRMAFDYAALTERRRQLNHVVRALHQIRSPLEQTIYQVQGRFAAVRDAPHVPFKVGAIEGLDPQRLMALERVSDRVRLRNREFREHWTSRWRVLKRGTPSLELSNRVRHDMRTIVAAVQDIRADEQPISETLGLSPAETLDEVTRFEELARHLAKAPGVPQAWLSAGAVDRLRASAERWAAIQSTRCSPRIYRLGKSNLR